MKNKGTTTKKYLICRWFCCAKFETKYFRVAFKERILFGSKLLKYGIEFYHEFCEKNVFKFHIDWFKIKS
jgi:hypothetical protein